MSATSIPPMSPENRKALSTLQDAIQDYMETRWSNSEEMEGEERPFLMDFACAVQVRTVDQDGTIHDAYAVIRNLGQAPHVTKGVLQEGIETIQEEQVLEDEDE